MSLFKAALLFLEAMSFFNSLLLIPYETEKLKMISERKCKKNKRLNTTSTLAYKLFDFSRPIGKLNQVKHCSIRL